MGSVAVDSQTGMEHYNVPKQASVAPSEEHTQKNENSDTPSSGFTTPNYGEVRSGKTQNLAGVPEEFLNLFEHDPSEVILMQATRHPIGVIAIFSMAGIAVFLVIIAYVLLGSGASVFATLGANTENVRAIGALISLVLVALITGISLLAAHVYKKSRLILTNQKVVLIQYHSIIAREVSQLNIGEVEDVNVAQPTLMDRIFKTGRITIETAGEQNNYVLTQVEKPYDFARKTIQMHEGSIAKYGNQYLVISKM